MSGMLSIKLFKGLSNIRGNGWIDMLKFFCFHSFFKIYFLVIS